MKEEKIKLIYNLKYKDSFQKVFLSCEDCNIKIIKENKQFKVLYEFLNGDKKSFITSQSKDIVKIILRKDVKNIKK